ncbi:MAG: radical SAM protein [Polyangiales bacterium]
MSSKPDVVLINPASRKRVYQGLGDELAAIEPPVWAGLLAGYARRHGLRVQLLDAEAENLSAAEVADAVADGGARLSVIVAYGHQPSASTQVMPAVSAVAHALKAARADHPVLLLGGHVAALPERTLREEPADFVCTGEGPVTLVALAQALAESAPALSKVPGLMYREHGLVRTTAAAPLVRDLDQELPGVSWDLLPMTRYRAHNWHCFGDRPRQPYAALYTSLGCPFKCTFCCIQAPFKSGEQLAGNKPSTNTYRMWSSERVVGWIDTLVRDYGVTNIKLADEMFVLNKRHVMGICDGLIARKHDLNVWAYARVDTVSDELIPHLRDAGFRWLALGIEAASEDVRNDVDKGFERGAVERLIEKLRAAGIHVIANYIFGLPEDDLPSMRATLDLAKQLNTEFANLYCAMAYPGSQLYRQALDAGWRLPDSWAGYSQHAVDTLPLPTRHLEAREVLRFRDQAFLEYFQNPRYLAMVQQRFGDTTLQHIQTMSSKKIERRYL